MDSEELEKEIRQRVIRAAREKIWQKALLIAETFGKKSVNEGSSHTTTTYDFTLLCGFTPIRICKSNYVMGGDYLYVHVDDTLVFEADLDACGIDLKQEEKINTVMISLEYAPKRRIEKVLRVKIYLPGEWENLLNFRSIKKAVAARAKKEKEEKERRLQEENRKKPLTDEEKKLAKNFGIDIYPLKIMEVKK